MKIKKTPEGWELIPQTQDEESRMFPLISSLVSYKVVSGYVSDVNDGEAGVLLDVPLDDSGHPDIARYTDEHDGDYPDRIKLEAERWMQPTTRLVICIARHADDEPEAQVRATVSAQQP